MKRIGRPPIRRWSDPERDVRGEAVVGLVRRGDVRDIGSFSTAISWAPSTPANWSPPARRPGGF
jgi:hypothetical protein